MRNNKWIGGQGLVEFALILPILLLLVIGALDFGRAFYMKVVMENSAREGAYYMTNHTDEGKATAIVDGVSTTFALAKQATQVEAEESGFTIPLANIEVICMQGGTIDNTCPPGSTVIVTVRSDFEMVVDVLFGGPITMVNDARMFIP